MILGGDIYQMHTKKRDPYLKKEDRGMVPGGSDLSDAEDRGMVPGRVMVTGEVCSMYFQHYIRLISLIQKGRDYIAATIQGEHPQEKNGPLPLMSKGER
jgi:hypothetical protein